MVFIADFIRDDTAGDISLIPRVEVAGKINYSTQSHHKDCLSTPRGWYKSEAIVSHESVALSFNPIDVSFPSFPLLHALAVFAINHAGRDPGKFSQTYGGPTVISRGSIFIHASEGRSY